ncbi:MAG: OmpH family outer membrane protein [Alphaproteobacteria bacterium]
MAMRPGRLMASAAVAASLFCLPVMAAAQSIPPPTVMVIDTNRIMAEARSMQAIRDQIERIRGSFQNEIKNEEDELRRADQEMAEQRQVLSSEAFNQRRQQLQERAAALQLTARTRRTQLDQGLRNAIQIVRETLIELVQATAQKHGANVVIQKSDLVWADARMEFTDEVLRQLDARLSTVKVEMPPG